MCINSTTWDRYTLVRILYDEKERFYIRPNDPLSLTKPFNATKKRPTFAGSAGNLRVLRLSFRHIYSRLKICLKALLEVITWQTKHFFTWQASIPPAACPKQRLSLVIWIQLVDGSLSNKSLHSFLNSVFCDESVTHVTKNVTSAEVRYVTKVSVLWQKTVPWKPW